MTHIKRIDEMLNSNEYVWRIFETDDNMENVGTPVAYSEDLNSDGFATAEDALDDAINYVEGNREFMKGNFSIEVFNGEDFVIGEEMKDGVVSNFNNR